MKTTITLFFLLASLNLYSQPYWMWENPRPSSTRKFNGAILDASNYFAIGDYGSIIKTSNAGSTWYQMEPVNQERLNFMTFIDLNTGFITDGNAKLFKTVNSGVNWTPLTIPPYSTFGVVKFLNEHTGYLTAINALLKTTDKGITWSNVLDSMYSSYSIVDVEFPNEVTGYASTGEPGGVILKTTNSGNNWISQFSGGFIPSTLAFTSPDSGFALYNFSNGNLLRTTNGGAFWYSYNIGTTADIKDIKFINSETGYVTGQSPNVVMKTTNAGNNWFPINASLAITKFNWLNESTALGFVHNAAVLNFSPVYKTTNGGYTWFEIFQQIGKNYKINSIAYADTNYGVAVCDSGRILRTNNGVWTEVPIGLPLTSKLYEVKFINSFTGFIGGTNTFLKSTDKGVTWVNDFSIAGNVRTIDFMNELTGYVSAFNLSGGRFLYKTTNSGLNWVQNISPTLGASFIHFVNNDTGLIGGGGVLYRTTNGGNNWTQIFESAIITITDAVFFNQNTGFLAGADKRTTNAGLNWIDLDSANTSYITQVNSTTAIAITSDGHSFRKTTDLGLTWHPFSQQANAEVLNHIEYLPNGQLVVGGNKGNILRTFSPGTVGINNHSEILPTKYFVSQNYPNPFNPVTKIKYDVPYRSHVKITIFDISGREIRTLINNFRDPGKYEIIFDGSGLSSGVYFYRIQTDDFSQTRKMILLK